MKTVFNSNQVIHVWASRKQDEGCNPGRSIFFNGNSIFSYGSHFEMARHITEDIVFVTTRSYSVTTAKHLRWVRFAVDHKTVYTVPTFDDHIGNLKYLVGVAQGHYDTARKSIKYGHSSIAHAGAAMLEARSYATAFEISVKERGQEFIDLWNKLADGSYLSAEDRAKILERANKAQQAEAKRDEARRIARELYEAQRAIEEVEKLAAWMRGEDTGGYWFAETRLRIKGDTVQTSKGAEVPTIEARNLYRALKLERDIVGQRVGHFTVSHVDSEVVRIGCHTIPMFEVERIGTELLAAK
jgi:hypothetical protein